MAAGPYSVNALMYYCYELAGETIPHVLHNTYIYILYTAIGRVDVAVCFDGITGRKPLSGKN